MLINSNLYIITKNNKLLDKILDFDISTYKCNYDIIKAISEKNKNGKEIYFDNVCDNPNDLRDLVRDISIKIGKKSCIILADYNYEDQDVFCICSIGEFFEYKKINSSQILGDIINIENWTKNAKINLNKREILEYIAQFNVKSTEFAKNKFSKLPLQKKFTIVNHVLKKYTGNDEEIAIPKNVKVIGNSAFEGCTKIKKVIIPDGVEEIENRAFYHCINLSEIVLPNTLKKIDSSFVECKKLNVREIIFPDSIEDISWFAFEGCPERKGFIRYSSDKKKILYFADTETEVFIIPRGVEKICGGAFRTDVKKLKKVIIPDSVTEIASKAFFFCKNIEEVYIEGKINIGEKAFPKNKKLIKNIIQQIENTNESNYSLSTLQEILKQIS